MEKEKTMREIYYEIKELRNNPTPDNLEKINSLHRELINFRDAYEDSIDTSCCILDHVTVITLILVSVLLLILCINFLFLP